LRKIEGTRGGPGKGKKNLKYKLPEREIDRHGCACLRPTPFDSLFLRTFPLAGMMHKNKGGRAVIEWPIADVTIRF
jgi:hypothetical protein